MCVLISLTITCICVTYNAGLSWLRSILIINTIIIGITFCALWLHLFFLLEGTQCFNSSVSSGFHSSINNFSSLFYLPSLWLHGAFLHRIIQTTSEQWSFFLAWIIPHDQMPVLINRTTEQKLVRGWQKSLYKADEMDCEVWFPGSHRADLCANHVAERAILSCVSLRL